VAPAVDPHRAVEVGDRIEVQQAESQQQPPELAFFALVATEENHSHDDGKTDDDDIHDCQKPYGRPPVRGTVALRWLFFLDRWKCRPSSILLNAHCGGVPFAQGIVCTACAVMSVSRLPRF
jgi:hypothetical protein